MTGDATAKHDLASLTGTVVGGDYRIERPLGRGGMGTVYVAHQLSTGKPRALKLMRPELLLTPGSQARFAEEARLAARVDSEHVVQVVAAGFDPALEVPWIAMELLSGESLAEHLARAGALEPREAIEILRDVCRGLAAAHRAGLVHRDLKPENVFLARHPDDPERRTAKLLDFGIAKLLHSTSAATTSAMGSPAWVAPEQANGEPVSPATDVWALGLLAFQVLAGGSFWRAARGDGSIQALLTEILLKPIPPASERAAELGRALPPAFDAWFAGAVVREPAARHPDPLVALAALEGALGASATGSLRLSPEPRAASGRVVVRAADEAESGGPLSLASAPTAAALQLDAPARARGKGRVWAWAAGSLALGLGAAGGYAYLRASPRGADAPPASARAEATDAPERPSATAPPAVPPSAEASAVVSAAPPAPSATTSAGPPRVTRAPAPTGPVASTAPSASAPRPVQTDPKLLAKAQACLEQAKPGPVSVLVNLHADGRVGSVQISGNPSVRARRCIVTAATEHHYVGPGPFVVSF